MVIGLSAVYFVVMAILLLVIFIVVKMWFVLGFLWCHAQKFTAKLKAWRVITSGGPICVLVYNFL